MGEKASTEGLFVVCLTSQQHACVSQGRIRSENSTCCHTEQKQQHQRKLQPKIYTSHIKLSTVYMYPHISSWRHSEKRADSNQARAYKAKRRGIKLTRETALAWEKRIFHFPHLVSPASLLQNRHSYRNFALFIPRGNEVTKTLVHTTS